MHNRAKMQNKYRLTAMLCLTLLLAACSLPRAAPMQSEVLAGSEDQDPGFAVYLVNRTTLPILDKWPKTGETEPTSGWINRQRGPADNLIVPGDILDIQIWSSEENSLLVAFDQKSAALPASIVTPAGTVFIPYLGDIRVINMTPENARSNIQKQLETQIPAVQVRLVLRPGRLNSVDLIGGVSKPGSYPLPDRDFTVLGLIAQGGGVQPILENPQIRLQRNGRIYGASIDRIYAHPAMDTTLRGGDKIIIEEEERYFISLGSAGVQDIILFDRDRVTGLEAITLAGGLHTQRANPQGILVLREFPASEVAHDGRPTLPSHRNVIFAMDLTSADGLFSAKNFEINPGDVVLATESPVVNVRTIFSLVGSLLGISTNALRL